MKKYDMLNKYHLTLLIPVLLVLSGCWSKSDKNDSVSKLVVINVLDKNYYDDCHITGSINIPFEDLEAKLKDLNKKDQYVVYCSNYACTAAPYCAKMMKDAGFDKMFVFHAGIVGWYQKKYPHTGPAVMSYLRDANDKLDEDSLNDEQHTGIVDISAEELKTKMEEAHLLS